MVSLRGTGFLLGGIGAALFLGAIVWALVAPPDSDCEDPRLRGVACERHNYGILLTRVTFVIGGGLVLLASAIVMLMMHLSQNRKRPADRAKPPGPPPARPPAANKDGGRGPPPASRAPLPPRR